MKISKAALLFLAFMFSISLVYFIYYQLTYVPPPEHKGLLAEIGEGFGAILVYALVLLYCRGGLKLLLNHGPLWDRFLPQVIPDQTRSWGQKLLRLLNRSHPLVGGIAILLVLLHALLVGTQRANPFLWLTIAVMLWQGGFGLFLRFRQTPQSLRKHAYLVHAQLVTGGLILIFGAFGHLLTGD